jgi:hypothetical protein
VSGGDSAGNSGAVSLGDQSGTGAAIEETSGDSIDSLDAFPDLPHPWFETEAFDPGGETGECANVSVMLERIPPTVVLLVDQSFSMTFDFGDASRWDALYDTLFDPTSGVIPQFASQVRFGLTLYTATLTLMAPGEPPECPRLRSTAPAIDNAQALAAIVEGQRPLGDTPTGESLEAVARDLAALDAEGLKVIVLATDGEPDTCAQPMPDEGQPESLAAAELAFSLGLRTYIVSVGEDVSQDHLQQMANVGIGKPPDDPMPAPFYQALDAEALSRAFAEIVGAVVSCEFEIDGVVDLERACEGEVLLNGQPLSCEDDWTLNGNSTLQLTGEACERLRGVGEQVISATWPCDVVGPIP